MPRRRAPVVALNRKDIRDAKAFEDVTHVRVAQDAADAGELLLQVLGGKQLVMVWTIERIDKRRAGNFDFDRLPETGFDAGAIGVDGKRCVVTGGAGKEEFGGMKIAEVFVGRGGIGAAVGHVFAEGLDVERQQYRHRTFSDAGKALFGNGV